MTLAQACTRPSPGSRSVRTRVSLLLPHFLGGAGRRLCLRKTGRRARSFSFLGGPAEDRAPLLRRLALGCATWHTPPDQLVPRAPPTGTQGLP
jgi:hypothetical protein